MSATKNTLLAIFVLGVTFAAGIAVGVFGVFVMHKRRGGPQIPPFATEAMVQRLDRHLDLTDEQRAKIMVIVEKRHQRINSMWQEIRPRVDAEITETNAEIEKILTPEQREKFQKMKMHLLRRPHHGDRRRTESTR